MNAAPKTELEVLVLKFFGGDAKKTALWFCTKNPLLGGISPYKMILFGRYDKLLKWAKQQISENQRQDMNSNAAAHSPP